MYTFYSILNKFEDIKKYLKKNPACRDVLDEHIKRLSDEVLMEFQMMDALLVKEFFKAFDEAKLQYEAGKK